MSEIRSTYSGLISFGSAIISSIIGMVFVLIVTRTVSQIEYGTWGLISGLIVYAVMIEPNISTWVVREISRGEKSGRTAIISGLFFSLIGILIYLITVLIVGPNVDADQTVLLFAFILIPPIFVNRILTHINWGFKPELASYGQIAFVITELFFALLLVYYFQLGVIGIIISVAIAYSISSLLQASLSISNLKEKFNLKFLKKWIKLFWLPLYPSVAGVIPIFDVSIFAIITGSVFGLSFWAASLAITGIITSVGMINRALYPKILSGSKENFLSESIRQLFYFGIPLIGTIIIFSKVGLYMLNPNYQDAYLVVIITSIHAFLLVISRNFQDAVTGTEQVDLDKSAKFRDYVKSKLFFIPSLIIIKNIFYIISLTVLLLLFSSYSTIDLVTLWAILLLLTQIPFTIYSYSLLKNSLLYKIEYKKIFLYLFLGVIVFGFNHLLVENYILLENNILKLVPITLSFAIFGLSLYFIISYFTDIQTKNLFKSIIRELKSNQSLS